MVIKLALRVLAPALLFSLGGCISAVYIDSSVKDVGPQDRAVVAHAQAVQLFFNFQTKGVDNAAAAKLVKDDVTTTVQASGVFSQVSADPVPSGAILHVTINNIPLDSASNDFAKGFMTGFTFGLVGSTAGDGYVVTADYLPGGNAPQIEKVTRDAIYAAFGTGGPPPNKVEKVSNLTDAVHTMVKRTVANTVNDLAKDPAFPK